MDIINNDALGLILRKLPPGDVVRVGKTCKRLRRAANEDSLWRDLMLRDFQKKVKGDPKQSYWDVLAKRQIGSEATLDYMMTMYICKPYIVAYLLKCGVSPTYGLWYAVRKGCPILDYQTETFNSLKLLINAGANVNRIVGILSDTEPLLCYVSHGNCKRTRAAEILLKAGANPNISYGKGRTPMYWAKLEKNEKLIKLLNEYGA